MKKLEEILQEHALFQGLDRAICSEVCGCARNTRFVADEHLFREGGEAEEFYLIRQGRVALEFKTPDGTPLTFRTVHEGDLVGISWLVPPYRWHYDARALEPTRAIAVNALCLRQKCEQDHDLGYEMMKRFVPVLVERLHTAQLQLVDVYGVPD